MKMMAKIIALLLLLLLLVPMPAWAQLRSCWDRLADCITTVAAADLDQCCPEIRVEVINDLDCFCSIKPTFEHDPVATNDLNNLLYQCAVSSSIDKLCPATPPPSYTHDQDNDSNSNPDPPPRHSEPSSSEGNNLHVIVPAIVVPLVSAIVGLIKLYFYIRYRKRKRSLEEQPV